MDDTAREGIGLKRLYQCCLMMWLLLTTLTVSAQNKVENLPSLLQIKEWQVPWSDSRPRDPYVAPDGTVWFVGQVGDYVASLDPVSGKMHKVDIPGAGPHTVIVSTDGTPWYAGNKDKHIGKLVAKTGEVTLYPMPNGIKDPHTMAWTSNGDIWFTAQWSNTVARLDTETGKIDKVTMPRLNMRPYGLVVDGKDRPWIAFMGENAIGTINPYTMQLEVIKTPSDDSLIRRIGLSSDGRVWWGDYAAGHIGVYDPNTGSMKQWASPAGELAGVYALTVDNQDRLWYVETAIQPNRFIGFNTRSEQFISIDTVPSGGRTIRHMVFDKSSNAIWFATDANTVGRAIVPE